MHVFIFLFFVYIYIYVFINKYDTKHLHNQLGQICISEYILLQVGQSTRIIKRSSAVAEKLRVALYFINI